MGTSWDFVQSETGAKLIDSNGQQLDSNNLLFYLKWNHFQTNLTQVFDQLLKSESFVDVTLACDGHSIKAHKVVLSACSPYFQNLFAQNPCQHPIVIMRDVTWPQLRAIVEFMYKGEINVAQEHLAPLLMVAEMLKIRGLTEVSTDQENSTLDQTPVTVNKELLTENEFPADANAAKAKSRKRSSTSSETCTTYITLPTQNTQVASTKIITTNKCSTTLQPLTTVPFVSYTRTSTYQNAETCDTKNKTLEEPPIKQIKSNFSSTSTSGSEFTPIRNNNKAITWTQDQLHEAIQAVVTQKMRFTQASATYGIPKGTLYDNILGKTKRMLVLDEAGLSNEEEKTVLEFCCDVSVTPYNRRTRRSLISILEFVEKLRRKRDPDFAFSGLAGFRWWWAFCKKHSIVSLYYDNKANTNTKKLIDIDSPA